MAENRLQRFVDAQQRSYALALEEIKSGRKSGHWMWFIFPQIQGLGFSETSKFYAIKDLSEAEAYLQDPVLGGRLMEISRELLRLPTNDAHKVFGSPDDLKLMSSMTLFSEVDDADPVFESVLQKFFKARKDDKTVQIIGSAR